VGSKLSRAVIGAVMAGGRGTRCGGPKAALELCGRALIEYPLVALTDAGLEPVVVAKRDTPLPDLEQTVWYEPDEPTHPLCGIVAALERADGRAVVACGCDMPFVTAALAAHVAALGAPLAVPRAGGRLHPLLARYEPLLLGPLTSALEARKPLQETVAELEPFVIDEAALRAIGDPSRLLFNVNTRADLARAEQLLCGAP
jgi:molybdopterin-guanine dinucleotide biosynthesis protein A